MPGSDGTDIFGNLLSGFFATLYSWSNWFGEYADSKTIKKVIEHKAKDPEALKERHKVLEQIKNGSGMKGMGKVSQGYRLVNIGELETRLQQLKSGTRPMTKDESMMLQLYENRDKFISFLDKDVQQELVNPQKDWSGHSRHQVANARLKLKQMILLFPEICEAQEALKLFAENLVCILNKQDIRGVEISTPPGAYGGIKDFIGAYTKITSRSEATWDSNIGSLKDAARLTIVFPNLDVMEIAKYIIMGTEAFKDLAHDQKALKDRYHTGQGEAAKYNFGDGQGYKDIKFFLKVPTLNFGPHIAELQLNTTRMIDSKKKGHILYDVTRLAGDPPTAFDLSKPEGIAKVIENMNSEWFDYLTHEVRIQEDSIVALREFRAKFAPGVTTVPITDEDIHLLNNTSILVYKHGDVR